MQTAVQGKGNDLILVSRKGKFLFPIEFQSSFDKDMDSRMMACVGNAKSAWRNYAKSEETPFTAPFVISNIGNADRFASIDSILRRPCLDDRESAEIFLCQGKIFSTLDMIDFRPRFRI